MILLGERAKMEIKTELKRFLVEAKLVDKSVNLDDGQSLLDEGIIDSLGILELTNFISERYGVTFDTDDLIPENFESILALENYVNRKLSS